MDHIAHRSLPTSLPNILTYGRIAAVPVLAGVLFFGTSDASRWVAFAIFVAACVTDWLDGYLARIWEQQSTLGRMLDPIADKLLVGVTLLMLVYTDAIGGWSIWAAIIILSREILVSGLREFLAEFDVLGDLVAGEPPDHERAQFLFRQLRRLLHREQLRRLA